MKLSKIMKKEIDNLCDEYILEGADTVLDKRSSPIIIQGDDKSVFYWIKKAASVAACFALAIATVIAFMLIRNGVENAGDVPGVNSFDENSDIVPSYESREEYGFIVGDSQYLIYNDYVIDATYKAGRDVSFYDVNDLSKGDVSIFKADSTLGKGIKSLGFYDNARVLQILLHPYDTERNKGVPVFYLVVQTGEMVNGSMEYYSLLMRYNMLTYKAEYLSDHHFPEAITSLGMYGNTVFMTADNFNFGHEIYAVNTENGEYKVSNKSDMEDVEVVTADGEYLYYYIYSSDMGIYRCTHDLENSVKIADTHAPVGIFLYDGYIYHHGTEVFYGEKDNTKTVYLDYRRTSLSDKNETEKLFDGTKDVHFLDGKMYWKSPELNDYSGTVIASEPIIHVMDLATGEDKVLADFSERTGEFVDIYRVCGDKMLLQFQCFSEGNSMYHALKTCILDLSSGELTEVFITKY